MAVLSTFFGSCCFNPSSCFSFLLHCYHLRNPFTFNECSVAEITLHYGSTFDSLRACPGFSVGVPLQALLIRAEFFSLSRSLHVPSDWWWVYCTPSSFYFISQENRDRDGNLAARKKITLKTIFWNDVCFVSFFLSFLFLFFCGSPQQHQNETLPDGWGCTHTEQLRS